MRKAFERQRRLDCPSVPKVSLNSNCRNETIPILRALQHIYSTPKVRDSILKAIARDVNGQSSAKHGRPGLSYWEILVLAAARLGCGYLLPRDQGDRDVVVNQTRVAQKRHRGKIRRASFDRGFHSPEIQKALADIVAHPCVPMPGSKQAAEQAKTASVEFRNARQSHPGIESAIGALQSGNGLKRCRDRSEKGFERYIGLGVLGRNLHVLGKLLLAREAPHSQAAYSRRKPVA